MSEVKLTEALKRFSLICKSCTAPRPGSNFLPLLAVYSDDEKMSVNGEELESLHRIGWLEASPDPDVRVIENSEEEFGGIDADYCYRISPLGRSALAPEIKEANRGEG